MPTKPVCKQGSLDLCRLFVGTSPYRHCFPQQATKLNCFYRLKGHSFCSRKEPQLGTFCLSGFYPPTLWRRATAYLRKVNDVYFFLFFKFSAGNYPCILEGVHFFPHRPVTGTCVPQVLREPQFENYRFVTERVRHFVSAFIDTCLVHVFISG